MRSRRSRTVIVCLAGTVLVGACARSASPSAAGSMTSSPSVSRPSPPASLPSPSAIPGLTWSKASVERPAEAFPEVPSDSRAPSGPGTAGHPGHFPGQAIVEDVAVGPAGLTAVGYVAIDGEWHALAWTSSDGGTWRLDRVDEGTAAFAVDVAQATDGRVVAVGRSGSAPAAWVSADGTTWQAATVARLGASDDRERMTTVMAGPDGLIAGGSVGPELFERRARFWRSADGSSWDPVADDDGFADGEVTAIARVPAGYVAIGRLGTGQRSTGSVAWRSADGRRWQRVDDPALAAGLASGLATLPDATLVAVGSDLDEREAVAWLSADGRAWDRAPREASRLYDGGKIRMTDVVATPDGLLGVGNFVGVQYGVASSWSTRDGRAWTQSPMNPALNQGEMLGVALGPAGFVAVGSFGAPDNYIPTIWLSPPPAP